MGRSRYQVNRDRVFADREGTATTIDICLAYFVDAHIDGASTAPGAVRPLEIETPRIKTEHTATKVGNSATFGNDGL